MFLGLLLVSSVVAGAVALSGTGAASLSGARASDVVGGLSDVSQTITIRGQATENGGLDYYTVEVSDIVTSGASVTGVSFINVGADADRVPGNRTPQYYATNHTVVFPVVEDGSDIGSKVTFEIGLSLDTTTLTMGGQHRYTVSQYDTARMEVSLSPQAAQFQVIEANYLEAKSSAGSTSSLHVVHRANHTMTERVRMVTEVTITTAGANYTGLTMADVTIRKNGGPDLATQSGTISINAAGDGIHVALDSRVTFHEGDRLTIVIQNASNPVEDSQLTVIMSTDRYGPVYAASGELEVSSICISPLRHPSTAGNAPGFGALGAAAALVGVGYFVQRRS